MRAPVSPRSSSSRSSALPSAVPIRWALLAAAFASLGLVACAGDDATVTDTPGDGGAGKAGAAGAAGSGAAGSAGAAGAGAKAGSAGTAGSTAGAAGTSGGAAGTAQGGAAGDAQAGAAGDDQGGAAGSTAEGCESDPGVGAQCSTKLKGACDVGHNKCIQGVLSCVPDFGPGEKAETCNGIDDDCDGVIDNGLPEKTFFQDNDKDGFGSTATVKGCAAPDGYVEKSGDCNDTIASTYPGAVELCNDIDDNCDGAVDNGAPLKRFYKDNDGDLYGGSVFADACTPPEGYVVDAGDCQDNNKNIYPGANEICNGVDDDCNGPADDELPILTSFRDVDGDGFAPANAEKVQKCDVPAGYALPKDVDGDGTDDWDCNDSANAVYPGAKEVCGDGVDNSCSGAVDRLCFTTCGGSWPYKLPVSENLLYAGHVDMDGNGNHEIWVQDTQGFAILTNKGVKLYEDSWTQLNFSRGRVALGDIDSYDIRSAAVQNVEILSGNRSYANFFKMEGGAIVPIPSTLFLYDASQFMATDFDRDGRPEFVSASWCEQARTKIYRYNRASGQIELVRTVDDAPGDNRCQYSNGRMLTDLDGDGVPELLAGNGYAVANSPGNWGGDIVPVKFTNPSSLTYQPFCAAGTCFSTATDGLFGGGVGSLFRVGNEIRMNGTFFQTNVPGQPNAAVTQYFRFDLSGAKLPNYPAPSDDIYAGLADIDRDGTPESSSEVLQLGLFDVNGDGFPDRIASTGTALVVDVWDPKTKSLVRQDFSAFPPGASPSVAVLTAWDFDADGRLDVVSRDASGNVYCHSLGKDTWSKKGVLPPRFSPYYQTYQTDPYEPNDGADVNGDGLPDEITRVPSALTTKGDFYGFLTHDLDKDFYQIDTGYSGNVTVDSPPGTVYDIEIYSEFDQWNNDTHAPGADGKPDGLIFSDHSASPKKSFSGASLNPQRYGQYRFTLAVLPHDGTPIQSTWPYWVTSPK
jgi:hypothetical protein